MTTIPCLIRGPYAPIGDTDFMCLTHVVECVLEDHTRLGANNIRKDEVYCPVAEVMTGDPD